MLQKGMSESGGFVRLANNADVLEMVLAMDSSVVGQLPLVPETRHSTGGFGRAQIGQTLLGTALHSLRTAKACVAACNETQLNAFNLVDLFGHALNLAGSLLTEAISAVAPMEVIQYLWEQFGERLKSSWSVEERRRILQATAISGQIPLIAFVLDTMKIPLTEPYEKPAATGMAFGRRAPHSDLFSEESFLYLDTASNWHNAPSKSLEYLQERGAQFGPAGLFLDPPGWAGDSLKTSDFTRFLVETVGVDVNYPRPLAAVNNEEKVTPIEYAVSHLRVPLVRYLFEHGAKIEPSIVFHIDKCLPRGGEIVPQGEKTLLDLLEFLVSDAQVDPSCARNSQGDTLTVCKSLMANPISVAFLLPYVDLGEIGADGHIPLTREVFVERNAGKNSERFGGGGTGFSFSGGATGGGGFGAAPSSNTDSSWLRENGKALMTYQQSWNPNWKAPNGSGMNLLHLAILHKDYSICSIACHRLGFDFLKRQEKVTLKEADVRSEVLPDTSSFGCGGRKAGFNSAFLLDVVDPSAPGNKEYTPIELAKAIGQDHMAHYMERILGIHHQ